MTGARDERVGVSHADRERRAAVAAAGRSRERARHWRVKVDQRGGGIGGGVPRMRAGWLPDRLVFVTRGEGPFELVYGSAVAPGAEVPLDSLLPG